MKPREEKVAVGVTKTTLRTYASQKSRITLLLAHGAGAPQTHPFVVDLATSIAAVGITVITFNFPYAEAKKRRPDPPRVLQTAFDAVAAHVAANTEHLLLGGKSMGGRIALEMYGKQGELAAKERNEWHTKARGFCFFGYPLNPPAASRSKGRAAAFNALKVPIFVAQGERDTFGGEDELAPLVKAAPKGSELYVVPTGDHSLFVRKSSGLTQDDVYGTIARHISEFVTHSVIPVSVAS